MCTASSHLGVEPRTFGLEVQRAIHCANGTDMESEVVNLLPERRVVAAWLGYVLRALQFRGLKESAGCRSRVEYYGFFSGDA